MSNDIDVILVRYCPGGIHRDMWDYTLSVLADQPVRVLARDNSADNIGLVKARLELLEQSTAPVIVLMDFDFQKIEVDFPALATRLDNTGIGMTIPYSHSRPDPDEISRRYRYRSALPTRRHEWEPVKRIPCNCMVMKRSMFSRMGGLHAGYHTAHADTEMCKRIVSKGFRIEQHNRSTVYHVGASAASNPKKREIWDSDHEIFESRRRLF